MAAIVAEVIKAPQPFPWGGKSVKVFLAGSIEMGDAPDWRSEVVNALSPFNVTLLDPWRDDWDNSWEQSIEDERFREQVDWELAALEAADVVLMYFAPGTMAPISLLEFGLFVRSGKLIVCCPEGFWRKGNVDIVCRRYGITQVDSIEEAIAEVLMK